MGIGNVSIEPSDKVINKFVIHISFYDPFKVVCLLYAFIWSDKLANKNMPRQNEIYANCTYCSFCSIT